MATNRDKHKEPVIRAFVSLRGETCVGASALLVAGFLCPLITHVISFYMENETKMVCPKCAEQVKEAATVCKHCGSKIKPITEAKAKKRSSSKFKWFVYIGLFCILGMASASMSTSLNDSRTASQTMSENVCNIDAYLKAKRFVKEVLKSPTTAEFPSREYSVTDLGDKTCEVTSYVDSQNGFGAMIRSYWSATVQSDGFGNWTLSEMAVDGEQVYP